MRPVAPRLWVDHPPGLFRLAVMSDEAQVKEAERNRNRSRASKDPAHVTYMGTSWQPNPPSSVTLSEVAPFAAARREEIARMLSGAEVTAEARAQADRLLEGV